VLSLLKPFIPGLPCPARASVEPQSLQPLAHEIGREQWLVGIKQVRSLATVQALPIAFFAFASARNDESRFKEVSLQGGSHTTSFELA
jgi:hypothetical protein